MRSLAGGLICVASASASFGDEYFLADNTNGGFFRGHTGAIGSEVRLSTIPGFRADLTGADTPGFQWLCRPDSSDLLTVRESDGAVTRTVLTSSPMRNIAFDAGSGVLYGLPQAGSANLLRVDPHTGLVTVIGPTGLSNPIAIFGMAFDPPTGSVFATTATALFRIDTASGNAVQVGAHGLAQAFDLDYNPQDGNLWVVDAVTDSLYTIDRGNAAVALQGRLSPEAGFVTAFAFASAPPPCYPDCDTSTGVGVLDIFDFLCFQNRFDAGAPYACDCDTSTGPGVCDIFDFLCFQNAYDTGCP